jgi:hypothetical protein
LWEFLGQRMRGRSPLKLIAKDWRSSPFKRGVKGIGSFKVYLAISRQGLVDALSAAKPAGQAVWCGSNAISEQEYQQQGLKNLSRFNYPLQDAKSEETEVALSTIVEHHPNETIWVEFRAEA